MPKNSKNDTSHGSDERGNDNQRDGRGSPHAPVPVPVPGNDKKAGTKGTDGAQGTDGDGNKASDVPDPGVDINAGTIGTKGIDGTKGTDGDGNKASGVPVPAVPTTGNDKNLGPKEPMEMATK